MTDRSLLSKSNLSSARLLSSNTKFADNSKIFDETSSYDVSRVYLDPPEQDPKYLDDPVEVLKDEAFDFGYYSLVKKSRDLKEIHVNDTSKSNFTNLVTNTVNLIDKFTLGKMNLLAEINKKKTTHINREFDGAIKCDQDLIFTFAREENDYRNFELPNFKEIKNSQSIDATIISKSDKARQMVQTQNSFILKKQLYEISKGNMDHAQMLNFEYGKKKERYEINLVLFLLKKYDLSSKPGSKTYVEFTNPYQELKRESVKLVEKYKKSTYHDIYSLNNLKIDAINLIVNFIRRIEDEVDDTPVTNNEIEVKKFRNYSKWKKKLSELVNIWELFQSNGIEQKFPVKYLILRKYLSNRGKFKSKQNSQEEGNFSLNFINTFIKSLFGSVSSKFIPKSVFMPEDKINIILEIITSLFLIYSLFSIPLVTFIGYTNPNIVSLNKYVDVVFYIEIMTNFRRVYKDKTNEYIYDLDMIRRKYLRGSFLIDFISTIPFYIFVYNNDEYYKLISNYIMCFKLLRIIKLSAIIDRIEAMKISAYVKIFKLLFLFMFFAHWIGCILFSTIDLTLDYSNMPDNCYVTNEGKNKENTVFECRYLMMLYNAAYMIPGQYTNAMSGQSTFAGSQEYLTYICVYMIGQVLSAFLFGGVASTVQNLNQGQTFFNNKMEMLNNHMRFYLINPHTQQDVKIYFNYLWQRHKDVIYGKHHFDLLSKSLREKFERLNLPGNEILLAKFYNLNPGNSKLIGNILMKLSKTILFPYEILFEVGSVLKGIYILMNGDIELGNEYIKTTGERTYSISYADIITSVEKKRENKELLNQTHYDDEKSIVFPMVSALIKTGRNWQKCYSENFADLLFLPLQAFDELVFNFPVEMHILKHNIMEWVNNKKLFENPEIFRILSQHSSRSISKYYLKDYDKVSIWIPIPIPISQRKIAGNYIETFVKKVRNQWREILLIGDLNMCLCSYSAVSLIQTKGAQEGNKEKKKQPSDVLESLRELTKKIDSMTETIYKEFD